MTTITIDGKEADITLENERTVGDVLAGLESWLRGSGYRLSGLEVDGEAADSRSLDRFFDLDLSTVGILNIKTSSWAEHAVQSIVSLHDVLRTLGDLAFQEREGLCRDWETGPEARFIEAEFPALYSMAEKTLTGEGIPPGDLEKVLEERLREFENPREELEGSGPLVEALAQRLRDLPLDIQTGKDGRAAETMGIFSASAEKLFRLFNLLRIEGLFPENLTVDGSPVRKFIGEFDAAVAELIQAYEGRDTVLIGDLAEYELAPRLLQFYTAIKV
jgi:hypothetical protein